MSGDFKTCGMNLNNYCRRLSGGGGGILVNGRGPSGILDENDAYVPAVLAPGQGEGYGGGAGGAATQQDVDFGLGLGAQGLVLIEVYDILAEQTGQRNRTFEESHRTSMTELTPRN